MRKTNIFAVLLMAALTSLGASAQHQFAVQAQGNVLTVKMKPNSFVVYRF